MPHKAQQEGPSVQEKPVSIYKPPTGGTQDPLGFAYRSAILKTADELCTIGDQEYNFGRYVRRMRARRRELAKRLNKMAKDYETLTLNRHGC